jgi:predicted ATP-dependent endonuclease of OLD family
MAISRVRIENFRSIAHCEFAPSSLCALVGENNAGKSNILDAISRVLTRDWVSVGLFDQEDFRGHNTDKPIVIEFEFSPPLTYQRFKYSESVEIPILRFSVQPYKKATGTAKAGDLRLEQACLKADGKAVMVPRQAPKAGVKPTFEPLVRIPTEVKDQIPAVFIRSDRRLADQLPSSRYSLLRNLLEDVDEKLKASTITEQKDGKPVQRPAREVFLERLASALQVLKIKDFVELEGLLRTHSLENLGYDPVQDSERFKFGFELFDSWDFYKALRLGFSESGTVIDATNMGHGAQNALIVAIFQAYEHLRKKGALILIEEPELFLHPHRRRFFYQTLRRVAQHNQIIYTTHSTHFVAIPEYEEVHVVHRDKSDATAVRSSKLKPTTQLREKMRKEFDPERNELFFARHIVLVEGDTEKLALPEYARRLDLNLDRAGCSIIEVGGKRSLKVFAEIVISFGIPLTIVFDSDSSDFGANEKDAENAYNKELHALKSTMVHVIELTPRYEAKLKADLGDDDYAQLVVKHGGPSKAIRARLIAADETSGIPNFVAEILATVDW